MLFAFSLARAAESRGAIWSAAFVFGIPAIAWAATSLLVHNPAGDAPRWLFIFIFVISLPLAPGYFVGGGISDLITFLSGSHATAIYWVGQAVSLGVNWYLYFLIFSIWIHWRNTRKQRRAAAEEA